MIIVGAGMAGLLAAAMLRDEAESIYEVQEALPNNHSALLRFRSNVVGEALNIPFKQVSVLKAIVPWRNPVADALAYSHKTNGTARLRSIISAKGESEVRWVAPTNLIDRMARKVSCPVYIGQKYTGWTTKRLPLISTMPMPMLMEVLGYPITEAFDHIPGHNIIADLDRVNAYCTLYVPNESLAFSRVSITGSRLIAECYGRKTPPTETDLFDALSIVGLDLDWVKNWEIKQQRYAKIVPIDESYRRGFISWASREHNIYSLGRFATWRPELLLDDVVKDVRVIQRLAGGEENERYHQTQKGNLHARVLD